jgi:membrane protein YqaA with SNARE-associated domain
MDEKMPAEEAAVSRKRKFIAIALFAAILIISVGGSIFLILNWEYVEKLQGEGYWGLFLIAMFAGSPIPIPTPNLILTFTMGGLLNPLLVGFISGLGNTIGNDFFYWSGRGGLKFFQNLGIPDLTSEASSSRIGRFFGKLRITRMPDFVKRNALLAVFILSMYPNPILMVVILGMGATRYNHTKFLIACWAGKTVEAMILSYLGYFGLRSFLRYIGIFMP